MKYKIQDIRVLDRNEQLINAVLTKYSTFEEFVNEISISKEAIFEYLKETEIESDQLKNGIKTLLNKNVADLFRSEKAQIREHIDNIEIEIVLYNEADNDVFIELISLCTKFQYHEELALINYVYSKFLLNIGKGWLAIEYIQRAINSASLNSNNEKYLIEFFSFYGLIYIFREEYTKAIEMLNSAYLLMQSIDASGISEKTKFLLFHRLGTASLNLDEYSKARDFLMEALDYAASKNHIIQTFSNIGIAYKKEKLFIDALKCYDQAYSMTKESDVRQRITLLNNYAELYMAMGDYDKALQYIEQAVKHNGDKYAGYTAAAIQSYIELQILRKQPMEAINKLYIHLVVHERGISSSNRRFILSSIRALTDYSNENNDRDVAKRTKELISVIVKNTNSEDVEYVKNLKAMLCDILIMLDESV